MESELEQLTRYARHSLSAIALQKQLIERIKQRGGDPAAAEGLLMQLKEVSARFNADLSRYRAKHLAFHDL